MLQQLINHSPDLKRLVDEGYQLEVSGGYLIVHHIPYLNSSLEIKYGMLICSLTLAGPSKTAKPSDHTMYFAGETPCNADGTAMTAIINHSSVHRLTESITAQHYFSSKPACGYYSDYYEKIRTYSEILSAQAKVIDNTVTTKPNQKKTN